MAGLVSPLKPGFTQARQAWPHRLNQPVLCPEPGCLLIRISAHKNSKEVDLGGRMLCVQIPAQSFSNDMKPELTTKLLCSQ